MFAQFGLWRWAFGAVAMLTAAIAVAVPAVLAAGRLDRGAVRATRIPVWALLLLGTAALAVSVAELPHNLSATAALLAGGTLLLVVVFVAVDRRLSAAALPPSAFGPGPLKWIYLTQALLLATAMVDTYVPLFGQRLAHLSPVVAGFLGAALAIGWTVSELLSASLSNPRLIARVVTAAPAVMAVGLALGALTQSDDAPVGMVAVWRRACWSPDRDRCRLAAFVGVGDGLRGRPGRKRRGGRWDQHRAVDLRGSGRRSGRCAGQRGPWGAVMSARWLFTVFTALAAVGVVASYRATRGQLLSR
ncbi:putative multidrug-efflux transporter [Mycobacterium xenopi 3993]|nr:putative multidrug-efflux transporter [Mycobacterium xenopi 3993]